MKEIMNMRESAEYLGYSYGYFSENIIYREGFPSPSVIGKERRWRKTWLDDYLDKTRVKLKKGRVRQSSSLAISSADSA